MILVAKLYETAGIMRKLIPQIKTNDRRTDNESENNVPQSALAYTLNSGACVDLHLFSCAYGQAGFSVELGLLISPWDVAQ